MMRRLVPCILFLKLACVFPIHAFQCEFDNTVCGKEGDIQ